VTKVPIACTLTAGAAVDRLAEWRSFLSSMVQKVDHGRNSTTLTLVRGTDSLMTAVDLAEREKACCSFFEFSIELTGPDAQLHVEVPEEAAPILADLFSVTPS
jgi:hypothetical protein